ncbi:ubiquitin-conjugating enzyme [Trichoderma cornu-damae]|uniref:Ubiquitin-conjugating enzyme n=1 Tax=Trichoderma cornu-damae TaxID=654480 RepID=A0A9P8QLQ5_9HYPO|nr:ubiquitin-conjugating enzyme [Trichoderma cornu-damae]
MTSLTLGHLPSLWRQHLLSEFAGLKQACPEGIFVSLTPGDPSLWSAVLFVRHGPYAPAVLRFQILFPDAYPRAPPLVTFSTDIFHPLITPLTTHMYTTGVENDSSTTERPKLPPGGFSLEHGFPEWFGGPPERPEAGSRRGSRGRRGVSPSASSPKSPKLAGGKAPPAPPKDLPRYMQTDRRTISTYSLLKYIRSAFDKAEILDTVPLAASGNPGAWHAWRTHRRKQGKAFDEKQRKRMSRMSDGQTEENDGEQGDAEASDAKSTTSQSTTVRRPGEWNWDGVWEDRVKKGVASTLTESVLYGATGISDDMIHFLALEEGTIEAVKGNLRRTLDASA